MAGVPFAADRGRDNRPGASPAAGGLVCDAGKEPNPGPGTTIPANMYSAQYPAATLSVGESVRWRWPAKNHANTPQAGTVEVYIANTPNAGDDFTPGQTFAGQMSYSSDNGDCLGLDQSTDTADCQGTWTVPNMAPGRYSIMWWWEVRYLLAYLLTYLLTYIHHQERAARQEESGWVPGFEPELS